VTLITKIHHPPVAILRDLQPVTGRQLYLFPAIGGGGRPLSESTISRAIRRLGYSGEKMTVPLSRMRNSVLLVASLLVLYGCHARDDSANLAAVARGLDDVWPQATRDARMTMYIKRSENRELLHCRLVNTSEHALELNRSALPWITTNLFRVGAVTAKGQVLPAPPPVVIQIVAEPAFLSIAPGETLEGDLDLEHFPIGGTPRNEDLLLIWSHPLEISGQAPNVWLSGITFLPKR